MNLAKAFIYAVFPPCWRCPYKRGVVLFAKSPCPGCKLNNYRMYRTLVDGVKRK
jgi:hypothetical protein